MRSRIENKAKEIFEVIAVEIGAAYKQAFERTIVEVLPAVEKDLPPEQLEPMIIEIISMFNELWISFGQNSHIKYDIKSRKTH